MALDGWALHKQNVMKFRAYKNHIVTEDAAVKAADHAKLKGYYSEWIEANYLLGCA